MEEKVLGKGMGIKTDTTETNPHRKNQMGYSGAPEAETNDKNGKRPSVLVADDEMNIRRAIWFILKKEFDVTTVENGEKVIEYIKQGNDFDVVLLDQQMPGMSGMETLKAVKQWSPVTEVLFVTAASDFEIAKGVLKLGAYDYINKPFKKEELRAAIRKGVERRGKAVESEKAQEQLALVKAQLIQSEKFSAIGQLIAAVVHELNSPLGAVMGFSELLLMGKSSPEQTRKYIENINKNAFLCKNIVQKLLSFSRKQEPQRELVQINDVIESTLDLKEHDFKVTNIQVVKELANNIPGIMADFYELQQVFLNMINNAHQAMREHAKKGVLTVKSERADKVIRISFRDTGPGIPDENLQKIFEPLFTTKEKGKGTGLGLSVCCEIIQGHNGNIYVTNVPDGGTCFIVELPISSKPSLSAPSSSEKDQELAK